MTPSARTLALAALAVAGVLALLHERPAPPPAPAPRAAEKPSAPSPPEMPAEPASPPASIAVVPAAPSPPTKPESEDAFMRELLDLQATDKRAALALAQKGEDRYPSTGKPAEARKAMIVTLLADLNRMDEARERARAFMTAFPLSEYLPLVQGATGIHPRPHGPNGVVY